MLKNSKVAEQFVANPTFNRGTRYKDCVGFMVAHYVFFEWRCPLYTGFPEEKFHCISNVGLLRLVGGTNNGFTFQTRLP